MDELFDFTCWVGSYELRLPDEPDDGMWMVATPIPRLYLTGPTKRVRPRRDALDRVVALLSKLQTPKWDKDWKDWEDYMNDEEGRFLSGSMIKPDPQEFAALGMIVSAASKQIGMLHGRGDVGQPEIGSSECLSEWIELAWRIKRVFMIAGNLNTTARDPVGNLDIFLVDSPSGGKAISIRPSSTKTAVTYHAARMVATGTAFQTCGQCRSPFLAGGMRGKKKKRAGSKFCTDQCRWDFNNAKLAKHRRRS